MSREKLTPREAAFVQNRLLGLNRRDSAIAAGYGAAGAHVSASRLLKRECVINALLDGSRRKLSDNAVSAVDCLAELMKDAQSEAVRLDAAKALLAHGGLAMAKQHEHRHVVEDNRTRGELLEAARALLEHHERGPVVDVVAEPVPALEPPVADPFADA